MKKGFTLVEVLAVIVILGLLVAIISPVVNNLLGDSEDALYDKQINNLKKSNEIYREYEKIMNNIMSVIEPEKVAKIRLGGGGKMD